MADTLKVFEGTLGTSESTIYTVPANKALIITEIRLTNKTATARTATLKVGTDNVVFPTKEIAPNNGFLQTGIQTLVLTTKTIKGSAAAASAIDYYISAVEVDV